MKNKLPESYTLEIVNNRIVNIDTVIATINNEENYEMLKEYQNFIITNTIPAKREELSELKNALSERLFALEQVSNEFLTLLDQIHQTYVENDEAIKLISKYINKENLTEEEKIKVYAFLSNAITLFEYQYDESLDRNEKDILHYTMEFLNPNNSAIERHLLNRYNSACQKDKTTSHKTSGYTKKLLNPESPLSLDEEGISLTIIIITVTILLGSVIAALLLVK